MIVSDQLLYQLAKSHDELLAALKGMHETFKPYADYNAATRRQINRAEDAIEAAKEEGPMILTRQLRVSLAYDDVKLLAESGKSLADAAKILGVPYSSLHRFSTEHSILFNRPEYQPRPPKPFNLERYKEIKALRAAGWKYEAIASLYGLTRERIRQVVSKGDQKAKAGIHE